MNDRHTPTAGSELQTVYLVERGEWSDKYGRYVYPAFRDRDTHDDLMAGLENRWHAVCFVRADDPAVTAAPAMLAALREARQVIRETLNGSDLNSAEAHDLLLDVENIDAVIQEAAGGSEE